MGVADGGAAVRDSPALLAAAGGRALHAAAVATHKARVIPFMQAVAAAAVSVLRFPGQPELRIAAPGGWRAVQAFSECMQRHPPA